MSPVPPPERPAPRTARGKPTWHWSRSWVRIAAGGPILAESRWDGAAAPRDLVGQGQLFVLTVVGDSMIEAAICDGDLVVIRSQPSAEPGEIVAALIGDEATVKTFSRRTGTSGSYPRTRPTSRSR